MELDHLAVAGETLEAAVDHVENALGVPMQPGGQHAMFGTHNHLLGLADGLYLEAIAVDPGALAQRRPRWFDLDRFSGAPRLCNWICRCDGLADVAEHLPVDVGHPLTLTRGNLHWQMAVPESGCLPYDNMFPALIEWHSPHPAPLLTQQGCRLHRLVVTHPHATDLTGLLEMNDPRVVVEPGVPGFEATFETPHGLRVLR